MLRYFRKKIKKTGVYDKTRTEGVRVNELNLLSSAPQPKFRNWQKTTKEKSADIFFCLFDVSFYFFIFFQVFFAFAVSK